MISPVSLFAIALSLGFRPRYVDVDGKLGLQFRLKLLERSSIGGCDVVRYRIGGE